MNLVWLRNDLRLDDHEALGRALSEGSKRAVLLYCFDPRHFSKTRYGFAKTGPHRARFLIECVEDLRQRVRDRGGDLLVRVGHPEEWVPRVARQLEADAYYYHEEVTPEETEVAEEVGRAMRDLNVRQRRFWGASLYHVDDLPFYLDQLPDVFTQFRKQVERQADVREPEPAPDDLPAPPQGVDAGEIPSVEELCGEPAREVDDRAAIEFQGGETHAEQRLEHYFWETNSLQQYKQTRNGMLGPNYSSKFSAWLAHGAISPRRIWSEVKAYEYERTSNDSTYWMIFELIWRDFFRFLGMREGAHLFKLEGVMRRDYNWKRHEPTFERWAAGTTGIPFVDANMRELNATGFMSNRGRQNVASFLAKILEIDWRWGAAYFESQLVDYDPCSNWGNWQYVSGVGNDPRDRFFNVLSQGERYDSDSAYIKHWLPVLEPLPATLAQRPWDYNPRDLKSKYGIEIGVDYPNPVIDLEKRHRQLRH